MKVVILAGGLGTRISEESQIKPKPMIEIGGKPILWHIMKIYSHFGIKDFIICGGYKQNIIKEYFANYYLYTSDVTFDFGNENHFVVHNSVSEPWKVTIIDTGLNTMTGGRIKRIENYVKGETFMLTYGDGVANIDINRLYDYHKECRGVVTLSAVQPAGRYGRVSIESDGKVASFIEKPKGDGDWINGGFFVCEPQVFEYLKDADDNTIWEKEPLEKIAADGKFFAFKHNDFWRAMDTLRDKNDLEALWSSGKAPWKIW
jgi:glucose-1-phosphate cytidylyltransferase